MKVLVTGANGFIGSAVVRELLARKHSVRCLIRKGSDTSNLDGLKVQFVTGDVTDYDSVKRALKGIDQVYHLAAIYSIWLPNFNEMYRVNVNGTQKVLNALPGGKDQEGGILQLHGCSGSTRQETCR